MYNVKVYRYPSGWQVRVYNKVVGYHDEEHFLFPEKSYHHRYFDWDTKEWVDIDLPYPKEEAWYNIFTREYEKMPKILKEPDRERSIRSSMGRTINRVYEIARANVWEYFFTLTFDGARVNRYIYDECVKKLSKWLNNIRSDNPDLKYLVVPEKHKDGAFHFHGLFANCGSLDMKESGIKTKSGLMIYNVGRYKFGFSTATQIESNEKVTKYISKYITKDLCESAFNRKRYWASRNLNDPDVLEFMLPGDLRVKFNRRLLDDCKYSIACQSEENDLTTIYYEFGEFKDGNQQDDEICSFINSIYELYQSDHPEDLENLQS